MDKIDLQQLINDYPECITNGAKLKAILLDTYPEISKAVVNTLVIMANSGIVKEIQDSENITELDKSRWHQKLEDEGLSEKAIETCFNLLMDKPLMGNVSISSNTIKTGCISKTVQVGQTIEFGSYWQGDDRPDKKTPIKWIVLAKNDGKILAISDKGLECKPFNTECQDVTWETCTLREWLNHDFWQDAFNVDEQSKINTTQISADANPYCNTIPGNITNDKVFLLSIQELNRYLKNGDLNRKCNPTIYAKQHGCTLSGENFSKNGNACCYWWLRTIGKWQFTATIVNPDYSVYYMGDPVQNKGNCVRPAVWIELDA